MGGTSKKVTIGYEYYLGVQFGLWKGPIDSITKISVDKRTAWGWSGTPVDSISIDAQEVGS